MRAHIFALALPLCLTVACDKKDDKQAKPQVDLDKECARLGEMAQTEGVIPPDLAPTKVETCKTDMAKLKEVDAADFEKQSKCLVNAKDYVAAQSCVEQATMKLQGMR